MATRLEHELTYDAPAERVSAMLADPSFRERVCEATGSTRYDVRIDGDRTGTGPKEVVIDFWQPTAGVPSFAKKLVGDSTNIVQRETWTSATHGDVTVTIPGKPGEMEGTAVLAERDGTTTETVSMEIRVRIPLVSGKLENLIATMLRKALEAENQVGRTYLREGEAS